VLFRFERNEQELRKSHARQLAGVVLTETNGVWARPPLK